MSDHRTTLLPAILFFLISILVAPAAAQSPAHPVTEDGDGEPVQVLLLGVSHFAGSEGDDFTFAIDDILEDHRQRELDEAARLLAEFGAHRSYLECLPEQEARVNEQYRRYLSGELDPTAEGLRNEIHQLGFRTAARSGEQEVACVDAEGLWLGDQARQVGSRHQPRVVEALHRAGEASIQRSSEFVANHEMVEYLRFVNSRERLYANHSQYIERFVQIGTFEGSELRIRAETELEGRQVVLAGDFGGFPVQRLRNALEPAGVVLADDVTADTDYVVVGRDAGEAAAEGRRLGARVMEIQEFTAYALGRSELYVGFPDAHIGADLVGEWYKRNLRIFANIVHDVDTDTDRIFVMFGAGHIWTLRQFFEDHPGFDLVPVAEVLR